MPPTPLADAFTATRNGAGHATEPDHCRSDPRVRIAATLFDDGLQRVARMLRRVSTTGGGYYDPLFARPDVVEDDYYRFQHQPCGW